MWPDVAATQKLQQPIADFVAVDTQSNFESVLTLVTRQR